MKRKILYVTLGTALCVALCCCGNGEKFTDTDSLFNENPVTIDWKDNKDENIYSFNTDVSVYSMNNRKSENLKLNKKYKLSLKIIDEKNYVRMDFDSSDMDINYRSMVSDGTEVVFFNPETETVSQRFSMSNEELPKTTNLSGLSRIDLEEIKNASKRLSLDCCETEGEGLVLKVPVEMLDFGEHTKPIFQTVRYDTTTDTLAETETCMFIDDGTRVTTSEYPVYEDVDGIPIKIGCVTIIDSVIEKNITGFNENFQNYESSEEIETISDDELQQLKSEGKIVESQEPVFGDQSNLSNQKTIVEKYDDILINNTDDSVFRIIM